MPDQKSTISPRLPEVGEFVKGVGRLVGVEIIPPPPQPPPTTAFIFEEYGARVDLGRNGKKLDTLIGLDYSGSPDGAVAEARAFASRWCRDNDVTATSEVVVIVPAPRRFAEVHGRENFYAREFSAFEALARSTSGLPDPVETAVWTSRGLPPAGAGEEADRA